MSLKKWQRRIFLLCWFAYTGAYLCRTNLAIALPHMTGDFGWDNASGGLAASIFFWVYALGQLINGYIGDKVRARPFIFLALLAAATINLTLGFVSGKWIFIVLWGLNGFFLSMLWGPILKTLSTWFAPEQSTRIGVGITTSTTIGNLISWGIVGQIIAHGTWRYAFWIPGVIVMVFSFIWVWLIRGSPHEAGLDIYWMDDIVIERDEVLEKPQLDETSLKDIVLGSKLWLIAIACIAQGLIKDGIIFWTPTILGDIGGLDESAIAVYSLAIPVMAIMGIFFSGWLNRKLDYRENITIIIHLIAMGVACIGLLITIDAGVYYNILFLGLAAALGYGANTLLLAVIPMGYVSINKSSTVAGFLDFCSYVGAGLGSMFTGFVIDHLGWRPVMIIWVGLSFLGTLSVLLAEMNKNKVQDGRVYNGET